MEYSNRLTRLEFGGKIPITFQPQRLNGTLPRSSIRSDHEGESERSQAEESPQSLIQPRTTRDHKATPRLDVSQPFKENHRPISDSYITFWDLLLNRWLSVAYKKKSPATLVLVCRRQKSELDSSTALRRRENGPYFLICYETFVTGSVIDFVYEYVDLTLVNLAGTPIFLNEREILAVAGQIVNALKYLQMNQLGHGHIEMNTILVFPTGMIKLGEPEMFRTATDLSTHNRDIQSLSNILVKLVTKANNSDRQTYEGKCSPELLDLIGVTASTNVTANEVAQHKFLQTHWDCDDLVPLISLAMVTSYRAFKITKHESRDR